MLYLIITFVDKAEFDQCKIHLWVQLQASKAHYHYFSVVCYNQMTIFCIWFKLVRSNVWIKWQIKSRASSSCLDQCFTGEMGDYSSCSKKAGKTAYTWWAKLIQWLSVLIHLNWKLSWNPKTWLHPGWFVVLVHSVIYWNILSLSDAHSYIFVV